MVITGPNQHPEQVVETDPALILATLDGRQREYSWKQGPPRDVDYKHVKIHVVNFKSQYDPFTIGNFNRGNVYSGEVTDYSVFPSWNHWPVAQMPSDGRFAKHPDRAAHSSLTHLYGPLEDHTDSDRPFRQMLMLEGMTTKRASQLRTLAKSWMQAPQIEAVAGCKTLGYNQAKREYPLVATASSMQLSIAASAEQPILNPCFAVRNWGDGGEASVAVEGGQPTDIRQGTFIDTNGTPTMVIWLELESTTPVEFMIAGAKPRQP